MTPTALPARAAPAIVVFGEAMIELSDVRDGHARVGVAGDTFNTAVYLARAGVDVAYATALGDESFSRRVRQRLAEEGIDASLVLTRADRCVGLYAIEVDACGERSFTYWRSTSAARVFFDAADAAAALERMANAPLLYLSGITLSLYEARHPHPVVELARTVRARGGQVAFDTNYRPRNWPSRDAARRTVEALLGHVSIALPTFDDERALFGDVDAEHCAARWRAAGATEVVVKQGTRGAWVDGHGWVAPPRIVEPVDTTGAGDSFNAAYLAARLRGATVVDACMAGHRLAGEVICHAGAIAPQAARAEHNQDTGNSPAP